MGLIFGQGILLGFDSLHWSTISRHLLSDTVFPSLFLKIEPNSVYQALDGCLIEMTTMGALVGRSKINGGHICLIEV